MSEKHGIIIVSGYNGPPRPLAPLKVNTVRRFPGNDHCLQDVRTGIANCMTSFEFK